MKLIRLDLLAVGPFTGRRLDLSAADRGLHVVVGPNEAGKSSALRAVAGLLYGFGTRIAGEDAVHKAADVRVGGTLRHSDGTEVQVIRRRGSQKTLLGADGKTPLADDALSRFLGTVDAATFATFFGLGHDTLRDGAAALLDANGQVGQALFAAGAGGKPLRVILDRYEAEAGRVYVERGKNQELPRALSQYKEARQAVGAASLLPETWSAERDARAAATAAAAGLLAEIGQLGRRRERVELVRHAIPLLAERAVIAAELATVADAPVLPADFAARRAAAGEARSNAAAGAVDARRRFDEVTAALADVAVPEGVLARADAIDDVYRRLAGYQRAVAARPALRAERSAAVAAVARLVADLRPGPTRRRRRGRRPVRRRRPAAVGRPTRSDRGVVVGVGQADRAAGRRPPGRGRRRHRRPPPVGRAGRRAAGHRRVRPPRGCGRRPEGSRPPSGRCSCRRG